MSKEMQNLKSMIAEIHMRAVHEVRFKRYWNNFKYFGDVLDTALHDTTCVNNLLKRLSESGSLNPKEYTLIEVFLYLIFAEGVICNFLNFVSYLLVAAGHDLYSLTKRKYVKHEFGEIIKVEMSTKIKFLNDHELDALTKEYDSTFRNDIAHHNYKIDKEGVLWVKGKTVNLDSKIHQIKKIANIAIESLDEIIKVLSAQN